MHIEIIEGTIPIRDCFIQNMNCIYEWGFDASRLVYHYVILRIGTVMFST